MRISHSDAVVLENVVRKVFSFDRSGMGGYIDADHFESQPFDAALIALAPLWKNADFGEIESFLYTWEQQLRSTDGDEINVKAYIDELDNIVTNLLHG